MDNLLYREILLEVTYEGSIGMELMKMEEMIAGYLGRRDSVNVPLGLGEENNWILVMEYVWEKMMKSSSFFEYYTPGGLTKCLKSISIDYKELRKDKNEHKGLRVIVSDEIRKKILMGPDRIKYKIHPQNVEVFEDIVRSKREGAAQPILSKKLKIDPRSLFNFLKRKVQLGLIYRVVYKKSQSNTVICKYINYKYQEEKDDSVKYIDHEYKDEDVEICNDSSKIRYCIPIQYQVFRLIKKSKSDGITIAEIMKELPLSKKYIEETLSQMTNKKVIGSNLLVEGVPEFHGKERRYRYYYRENSTISNFKEISASKPRSYSITRHRRSEILLEILKTKGVILVNKSLGILIEQLYTEKYRNKNTEDDATFSLDVKTINRMCEHLEKENKAKMLIFSMPKSRFTDKATVKRVIQDPLLDQSKAERLVDSILESIDVIRTPDDNLLCKEKQDNHEYKQDDKKSGKDSEKAKIDYSRMCKYEKSTLASMKYGYVKSRLLRIYLLHKFLYMNVSHSIEEVVINQDLFESLSLLEYFQIFGIIEEPIGLREAMGKSKNSLNMAIGHFKEVLNVDFLGDKRILSSFVKKLTEYLTDLYTIGFLDIRHRHSDSVVDKDDDAEICVLERESGGSLSSDLLSINKRFRVFLLHNVSQRFFGEDFLFQLNSIEDFEDLWSKLEISLSYGSEWRESRRFGRFNLLANTDIAFYFEESLLDDILHWYYISEFQLNPGLTFYGDYKLMYFLLKKYNFCLLNLNLFWKSRKNAISNLIRHSDNDVSNKKKLDLQKCNSEIGFEEIYVFVMRCFISFFHQFNRVDYIFKSLMYVNKGAWMGLFADRYDKVCEKIEMYNESDLLFRFKLIPFINRFLYTKIMRNLSNPGVVGKKVSEYSVVDEFGDVCGDLMREIFAIKDFRTRFHNFNEGNAGLIDMVDSRIGFRADRWMDVSLVDKLLLKQNIGSSRRRQSLMYSNRKNEIISEMQFRPVHDRKTDDEFIREYGVSKHFVILYIIKGILAYWNTKFCVSAIDGFDIKTLNFCIEKLKAMGIIVKSRVDPQGGDQDSGKSVFDNLHFSEKYLESLKFPKSTESVFDVSARDLSRNIKMGEWEMEYLVSGLANGSLRANISMSDNRIDKIKIHSENRRLNDNIDHCHQIVDNSVTSLKILDLATTLSKYIEDVMLGRSLFDIKKEFCNVYSIEDILYVVETLLKEKKIFKIHSFRLASSSFMDIWLFKSDDGWTLPRLWIDVDGSVDQGMFAMFSDMVLSLVRRLPGIPLYNISRKFSLQFTLPEILDILDHLIENNFIHKRIFIVKMDTDSLCFNSVEISSGSFDADMATLYYPIDNCLSKGIQ